MSRRTRRNRAQSSHKNSLSPTTILAVAALLVGAFFISKLWKASSKSDYADLSPLTIEDYIENGLSLRNNAYQLRGKVIEKPESDPAIGQLVFMRVTAAGNQEVEDVSIKVPSDVGKVNLETKHDYTFRVKVTEGGFLIAQDHQPL